jgi:hypothetical protein
VKEKGQTSVLILSCLTGEPGKNYRKDSAIIADACRVSKRIPTDYKASVVFVFGK